MSITIDGDLGISGVDGTAASPAMRGNDSNTGISYGTDIVTINTGGVARVTTDASGNVGVGVTPSAWGTLKSIDISTWASFAGFTNQTGVLGNAFYNGSNYIYKTTAVATRYEQNNAGAHAWFNAPSGTAGNAISFTQAMTLTADGKLGVGITSPAYKLVSVYSGNNTALTDYVFVGGSETYQMIGLSEDTANNAFAITNKYSAGGVITFRTGTGGTISERARIDSSGNLLVGATSAFTSTYTGVNAVQISGKINNDQGYIAVQTTQTAARDLIQFINPNGVVGRISTSGSSTAYNTSSDYRLKENVAPMTGALEKVAQLKPVTYTWKADGSAGQGFIAHELQAVVPDCVTGEKDAVETVDDLDAEGKKIGTKEVPRYQGVDTSFLVATLVAAIQEQQATIAAMKTRLAALEA